eukprot:scaffold83753_cov72-Phaeocystis_antarctica.AAC.6
MPVCPSLLLGSACGSPPPPLPSAPPPPPLPPPLPPPPPREPRPVWRSALAGKHACRSDSCDRSKVSTVAAAPNTRSVSTASGAPGSGSGGGGGGGGGRVPLVLLLLHTTTSHLDKALGESQLELRAAQARWLVRGDIDAAARRQPERERAAYLGGARHLLHLRALRGGERAAVAGRAELVSAPHVHRRVRRTQLEAHRTRGGLDGVRVEEAASQQVRHQWARVPRRAARAHRAVDAAQQRGAVGDAVRARAEPET